MYKLVIPSEATRPFFATHFGASGCAVEESLPQFPRHLQLWYQPQGVILIEELRFWRLAGKNLNST